MARTKTTTQLTLSDELASTLVAKAANNKCSTEDLLQSMLFRMESDEAFAETLATPALGERILADLKKVDEGSFTTNEEADEKFEALFRNLRAK